MVKNLYKKEPLPEKIPEEMKDKIREFAKKGDKRRFLENTFRYLTSRYKISRTKFVTEISHLNDTDINSLWNKEGKFIYCHQLDYLLRTMLVKSGLFRDDDIELKRSNTWYLVPHQYLKVRLSNEEFLDVDPWTFNLGIPFGKFAYGFHAGRIFPKN